MILISNISSIGNIIIFIALSILFLANTILLSQTNKGKTKAMISLIISLLSILVAIWLSK